jgi:hypothetical protein
MFIIIFFFSIFFLEILLLLLNKRYIVEYPLYFYLDWSKFLYRQDFFFLLGTELYNKYYVSLIFVGFLLMTVMIGSIGIVIFKKKTKKQILVEQLSSTKKNLKNFKNESIMIDDFV